MSRAFRCDRCGKCFAPKKDADFARMKDIMFGDSEFFRERLDEVDLCYECSEEFRKWLQLMKPTVDGDELS